VRHPRTESTSPPSIYSFHAFISYTTREEEVREIKPFVDSVVDQLISSGVTVCPVYYDRVELERRKYEDGELADRLKDGISRSAFTLAFVSPGYITSNWCQFEWWTTIKVHGRRDEPALAHSVCPIVWKTLPSMYFFGRARKRMLAAVQRRTAWPGHPYFAPSTGEAADISPFIAGSTWSGRPQAAWTTLRVVIEYLSRWYPDTDWRSAPGVQRYS